MDKKTSISREEFLNLVKSIVSAKYIPGTTNEEKKKWCVEQLTMALELFDNHIPIVGAWMDYPLADEIEKQTISTIIDWAWTKYTSSNIKHEENDV